MSSDKYKRCMTFPPPTSTGASETSGPVRQGLIGQLTGFDKSSLKKTDTIVKKLDGSCVIHTRDASGNCKEIVTKEKDFVPPAMCDLHVGVVKDNLFIASQDVAAEKEILDRHGITHVVNLANYVKNFFPETITYCKVDINDNIDQEILSHFDRVFEFVDQGRKKGGVLIHCNAGVSRAATFVIGYLMNREQMSLDKAYPYVKNKRQTICPNSGFLQQLRTYNEELGFGKSVV